MLNTLLDLSRIFNVINLQLVFFNLRQSDLLHGRRWHEKIVRISPVQQNWKQNEPLYVVFGIKNAVEQLIRWYSQKSVETCVISFLFITLSSLLLISTTNMTRAIVESIKNVSMN